MVLVYSARFRRRATTRPGSRGTLRSNLPNSPVTNRRIESIWVRGGRGTSFGGISPEPVLRRIFSHPSRLSSKEPGERNGFKLSPPDAKRSVLQPTQHHAWGG